MLIKPNFGESFRITLKYGHQIKFFHIGRVRSKNVPDSAARHYDKRTTAHPYTERDLQVLAAPDVHLRVIGAQVLEVMFRNGEKTTGLNFKIIKR